MAFYHNIKVRKKQVLKVLIFLSGVCILIWQIWKTFEALIEENTTFTVSIETFTKMPLPTILLCPIIKLREQNFNFANKTQFFQQFFLLNDRFNLSNQRLGIHINGSVYDIKSNLTLGRNFDEMGKTFFVQELMNPEFGICYALNPYSSFQIDVNGAYRLTASFKNQDYLPYSIEVQFTTPGEQHNFLFPTLGEAEERIPAKLGFGYIFKVRKTIWNYLQSKRKCKIYSHANADLYARCILKKQIECYGNSDPKHGCKCIAENAYKTHFKLYQNLTASWNWNNCTTNPEYCSCIRAMGVCYNKARCQLPCQKTEYKVRKNELGIQCTCSCRLFLDT